jgi:hypothetical protein
MSIDFVANAIWHWWSMSTKSWSFGLMSNLPGVGVASTVMVNSSSCCVDRRLAPGARPTRVTLTWPSKACVHQGQPMRITNGGRQIRDIVGADWLGADTATGAAFTSLRKFCTTTATGVRPEKIRSLRQLRPARTFTSTRLRKRTRRGDRQPAWIGVNWLVPNPTRPYPGERGDTAAAMNSGYSRYPFTAVGHRLS